jgi:hypothetical protein
MNVYNGLNIRVGNAGATSALFINSSGNMGIKTTTPDASSALEISGTSQGFLPPRLTTAQIQAISSPAEGLVVYNISTKKLNLFNGSSWVDMTGTAAW